MSDNYPSDVKLDENPDGSVSFATGVVETIAGLAAQDDVEQPLLAADVDEALERVSLAKVAEARSCLLHPGGLPASDQGRQMPTKDVVDGATE